MPLSATNEETDDFLNFGSKFKDGWKKAFYGVYKL